MEFINGNGNRRFFNKKYYRRVLHFFKCQPHHWWQSDHPKRCTFSTFSVGLSIAAYFGINRHEKFYGHNIQRRQQFDPDKMDQ